MKIYLDNAATTWPKPPKVITAISNYLTNFGVTPGRAGHSLALKAAREVFETRELLAETFHVVESENVVFTLNATHAINYALKGLLKEGSHVIMSSLEHNSVYRPLKHLESKGLTELSVWECNAHGEFDITTLKALIKPNTQAVIILHGSNVTGQILPIKQTGEVCRSKDITFIVDAAQTAGFIPIDMQENNIDILIFSGHKKLYGPSGTGGLCINSNINIESLIQGGSGSNSEMSEHPFFYPDHLEAGTMNTAGVIGLKAGIQHILKKGIDNIRHEQLQMTEYLKKELLNIEEINAYYVKVKLESLPLISFNINNMTSSEAALRLEKEFGIMTRAGLHCSPLAHKTIGTFPQGTVRISLGIFNTQNDINFTIEAIKKIILTNHIK